jgi:serine/threonine protein kinase
MSLDEPLDLEFVNKGAYGIIMKKNSNNIYIIKQFRVEFYEKGTSFDKEVTLTKLAYNKNNDIFINIIHEEISNINLASKIGYIVPLINQISVNTFGYIHMEYMNNGDLYQFIKLHDDNDLTGILGCYLNALYILHNDLKIVHGDLTPNNLLINYVGPNYRQKIIFNDTIYNIDTGGYCYKITDFGLAEKLFDTKIGNYYFNHIYRDYLLLYYIYFNQYDFYNFPIFKSLIKITLEKINDDFYEKYRNTDLYNKYIIDKYNYNSVCYFMNNFLEIETNNTLLYEMPRLLLNDFIDIISTQNV